ISRSDRAANHAGLRTPRFLSFPTQHLHGGRSLLLIIVRGMEIFRMDTKSEKLALFRYELIASLVIERLPRAELTRRAQDIAARTSLVFRSGHARALRFHTLPLHQTTRPVGKATARTPGAQEV